MKIVNVMISRTLGGIEQAFLDYTTALKLHHHEVCALIHKRSQVKEQLLNIKPTEILETPFSHNNFILIPLIYWQLKNFSPNFIIVHNKKALTIFRIVAKLLHAKIIAVSHNPKFKHLKQCDGIFTITDYQKDIFNNHGFPQQRIFTIPNLMAQKKTYQPLPYRTPVIIGTLGRFDPMKGFPDLIQALGFLKQQKIPFKAIIGGSIQDSYKEEYKKMLHLVESLDLKNDVSFAGWIKNKEEFFNSIDIFVLPSRFEPFGIVLLEAMIHSKPIISSLAEGPNEIFSAHQDAALLYETGNIAMLAERIKWAIENPQEMEKMSAKAYNLCVQKYSLEAVAEKLDNALNDPIFQTQQKS